MKMFIVLVCGVLGAISISVGFFHLHGWIQWALPVLVALLIMGASFKK